MKNLVFVPTVAEFESDIGGSFEIGSLLQEAGYDFGFMLVIRGGLKGVTGEKRKLQYANLEKIQERYGNKPVVIMLSNLPIGEIDFLHNTEVAIRHVNAGILFAEELPIGSSRTVTFHLNTLVTEEEFIEQTAASWRRYFEKRICPVLGHLASYALLQGIALKVETVPVPEFGDLSSDERQYRGVVLRDLRNPFYLTGNWGFQELRASGVGVCLDLCHSRTIYKMAELSKKETMGILFPEDLKYLRAGLWRDVRALHSTDLVHLNDGRGLYTRNGGTFEEGVALGEGDITQLPIVVNDLNCLRMPFVLEINENDHNLRPNTKRSIEYLKK